MSESQTKAGNQECFAKTCKTCKTCKLANLQNLQIDPLDMLNNFCFHVYAQKSLFIGENVNDFFLTPTATTSPSPVTFEFIELVPS